MPTAARDHAIGPLDRYELAATRTSHALDDLTAFARTLCAAPIAMVTVMEDDVQHIVAATGSDLERTLRSDSFCTHAMAGGAAIMEVPDAARDARFAGNPFVTEAPYVRFYAGAPLLSREGEPLGAVCVMDDAPRAGLTDFQRDGLRVLALAAVGRLEARRSARDARHDRAALADSEERFRTLADAMPQMVWSTLPDGYNDYYNARWYEFTGMPAGSTDGEGWNGMFHPDDQDRAWALWRHSLATGEPYQIEYRLRHADGTYRWVLGRALPMHDAATGAITRWFGTCTDIHERKMASEEREIISQELSHRIKNIFAVVAGLIQFAARAHPAFAPIASDLRQRITALGRAHDFVRPHSPASRPTLQQDSLHGLLEQLFLPYQDAAGSRIVVTGHDVTVDDRAATPLALLFHELATNASKYGALSCDAGRVSIAIGTAGDDVAVQWRERGGPTVVEPGETDGFGSRLIEMSAVRQLGGRIVRDWAADGLCMRLTVPRAAFSRPRPS